MKHHVCHVFRRPLFVRSILLAVLLVGASGCNEATDSGKAREHSNADHEVAEYGKTGSGTSTRPENATGQSVADNLPDGVLAYPDAVRVEASRIASKGTEVKAPPGVVMFISSEQDLMKVANWYEKELTDAGWNVVENSGDGEYYLFQKAGQGMSVSVNTIPEPKPDGHADAQLLIVIDAN